jgi:hypothetical protein
MPDWLKIAIPGIVGGLTAIVAAFLSARWAVQRAYREKWWERKEKAYAEIIESLHDMLRYCEITAAEYRNGSESQHPSKEEFRRKHTEGHWRIQKATDIGAFVISEESVEVLQRLRERPKLIWVENPPWEIFEEDAQYFSDALSEIRQCARRDLKV